MLKMLIEGIMTVNKWIAVLGLLSLTALPLLAAQGPLNTAVEIGTPKSYLNCSNSGVPSNQFDWTIQEVIDYIIRPPRTIATGCTSIDPLYETDSSKPNSCNLIILNAQPSQAVVYTCTPRGQAAMSAEVHVIETKAVCSSRGNQINGYTFYCGVSFHSPPVGRANFLSANWHELPVVNYAPQSGYGYSGQTLYLALFSLTPGVYDVPPNLCQAEFGKFANPVTPAGIATNIPSYKSQCNVTELVENKELTYITMSRNVGIIAGRTRVILTITSQGVVDDIQNVYFGDYTYQLSINSLKRINMSCLILDVYSPPTKTAQKVNIVIQNSYDAVYDLKDWFVWSDPTAYFEYKANPTITKLYPTTHLTSGGTRITIEGTNLDAAESSRLEMSVTIYRNNSTPNTNTTSADCFGIIQDTDPAYTKNKRLLCRMPPLNLPKDFLESLEETVRNSDNLSTKRRKRSVNGDFEVARFTNKLGVIAVATLSVVMDGLPPVLIESFTVDFIPISLVTFNKSSDVVRVKSGKPENLEIKGTYINKIDADNFVITIGNANCTIQSKQDNLILYLPPKDKPNKRSVRSATYCNDDLLDIQVSINQEHHNHTQWVCGCAEYYNSFPVLLVVLVTVLGGILIIIISMILIILCRTKFCQKSASTSNSTESTSPSVVLRNKSPKRTTKDNSNVHKPNKKEECSDKYHRTLPEDVTNDESIKYRKDGNNYNRTIASIYLILFLTSSP